MPAPPAGTVLHTISPHDVSTHRTALATWVTALGLNPNAVLLHQTLTVEQGTDGPVLRYTECVLTDDGHKQRDPTRPDRPWTRQATHPCPVPPPLPHP